MADNSKKKIIQRLGQPIADNSVKDEFDNLISQVEHKENVLTKQPGKTGTITLSGITKIHVANGQITGWE